MLRDIWENAPKTAATYVGMILLLYAIGMFLLLIHSIKQRTDQVTCYDVYMELCGVVDYFSSIFRIRVFCCYLKSPSGVWDQVYHHRTRPSRLLLKETNIESLIQKLFPEEKIQESLISKMLWSTLWRVSGSSASSPCSATSSSSTTSTSASL